MNEKVRGGGGAEGRSVGNEGGGSARMVAVVEIKRGKTSGGMDGVVMRKLHGGEMGVPVILEGVDIVTEIGEHDLVRVL